MLSIEDWDGCRDDKPIDIDVLCMVKNDKHRDMLLMKLHGYTEQEIADKHCTNAGTVHVTVQRVIANLRKELSNRKKANIEIYLYSYYTTNTF